MEVALGIIVAAVAIAWLLRAAKSRGGGGGRRRYKCIGCEHLRRAFDDGVMCGYGTRETYKTLANIRMCGDFEPARKR
jgi:hypothetical protein